MSLKKKAEVKKRKENNKTVFVIERELYPEIKKEVKHEIIVIDEETHKIKKQKIKKRIFTPKTPPSAAGCAQFRLRTNKKRGSIILAV